jgi:hypothetical protein
MPSSVSTRLTELVLDVPHPDGVTVRAVVAEDQALLREGLRHILPGARRPAPGTRSWPASGTRPRCSPRCPGTGRSW